MPSLIINKKSPFYYIRIYDRFAREQKRRNIGTKIRITSADRKRYQEWRESGADPKLRPKLQGNNETKLLLEEINAGFNDKRKDIEKRFRIKITRKKKLSEGLEEYLAIKARVGDPKAIRTATITMYRLVVKHFIKCNTDKIIDKYTNYQDFTAFLEYLEEEIEASPTTKSIYCRHLYALWQFFIKQNYCSANIIEKIKVDYAEPEEIPLDDMRFILNYLKSKNEIREYEPIYFMLLTGCRPSTAVVQLRSNIDLKKKIIKMTNVKARRIVRTFTFPIYKELVDLLKNILSREVPEGEDKLFPFLRPNKSNYHDGFWYWYVIVRRLVAANAIAKPYQLKQIRKTSASYWRNVLELDDYTVSRLLDHSSEIITQTHYIDRDYDAIRKQMDKAKMNGKSNKKRSE